MKLATKLVSMFMVLILLVIAADGWFSVQEETEEFERVERRDLMRLAAALRTTVAAGDYVATIDIIDRMNKDYVGIMHCRWVMFDAAPDDPEHPVADVTLETVRGAESGILFPVAVPHEKGRLAYMHVALADTRSGGLEVEVNPEVPHRLHVEQTVQSLRVAGALILLSALIGVFFGDRWIARPLRQLVDKTHRIGEGDLGGPIAIRGAGELGELGDALNRMCDDLDRSRTRAAHERERREEAVEQLRRADRLRTVGQLAAGIAHELGTPLGVVAGRAEMIAGGRLSTDDVEASARVIKEQSQRMSATVRQLLDFARPAPPERRSVDVRLVVDQTRQLMEPVGRKSGVTIDVDDGDRPHFAYIDTGRVQQILLNLLVNASHAMPDGGVVSVRLATMSAVPPEDPDRAPREYVRIDVVDRGVGMTEDVQGRIFDPFFTTKEIGEGTGMGLSVAYGIAQEHGGWISVQSAPGDGACFSVFLPVKDAA